MKTKNERNLNYLRYSPMLILVITLLLSYILNRVS